VAAQRPSKGDGPGRSSFEARCARTSGWRLRSRP